MADDDGPGTADQPAPGWWQASDGNWYPPEQHPDRAQPPTPGWWMASDGNWYPPEARTAPAEPPPAGSPPGPPPTVAASLPSTPPATEATAAPAPNRAPLLLGAIVVAVVIAGIAAFVLLQSSDDDDSVATPTTAPTATAPTVTGQPSPAPTSAVDGPTPAATSDAGGAAAAGLDPGAQECVYLGPDDFDDLHAELRFTADVDGAQDLNVSFALLDGAGQRFLTSSAFIEAAQPGETFRFDADTLEELPASVTDESAVTCEILAIEEMRFPDPPEVPSEADCEVTGVDSFGDVQVELTVTNPGDDQSDLSVDYALRAAGGVRFGSAFAFIEQVPPGETVRSPDDSFTDAPSWSQDLTCEIIDVDTFGS